MKKIKANKKIFAKWWLRIYWAALTVVLLSMMVQSVDIISSAKAGEELPVPPVQRERAREIEERFAGTGQNTPGSTTSLTFNEYSCRVIQYADPVIWTLVLLTIVIAGIVYATSMGQTGGGEMSIGLAKQMIVAAITGAVLYTFGSFLVGECSLTGSSEGGWIARLLRGAVNSDAPTGSSISNTVGPGSGTIVIPPTGGEGNVISNNIFPF